MTMRDNEPTRQAVNDEATTTSYDEGTDDRRMDTDVNTANGRTDLEADRTEDFDGSGSTAAAGTAAAERETLVPQEAAVDFRARWEVIQHGFVDDPRNAVTEADKLVDDLLKRLASTFDEQHRDLEKQWSDGEPSTEDLRSALQTYRAFFQRLLSL